MAGMLAGVAQGVNARPRIAWVPAAFLDAHKVSAWGDMPVWVPGQGDTFGFARRNIGKALAAGLTFRPLPVTAADTLAWFRARPPERQAKLKSGLTPERETALLAAWRRPAG
jgi:2'-hydroxyisoflavone reductase